MSELDEKIKLPLLFQFVGYKAEFNKAKRLENIDCK